MPDNQIYEYTNTKSFFILFSIHLLTYTPAFFHKGFVIIK